MFGIPSPVCFSFFMSYVMLYLMMLAPPVHVRFTMDITKSSHLHAQTVTYSTFYPSNLHSCELVGGSLRYGIYYADGLYQYE